MMSHPFNHPHARMAGMQGSNGIPTSSSSSPLQSTVLAGRSLVPGAQPAGVIATAHQPLLNLQSAAATASSYYPHLVSAGNGPFPSPSWATSSASLLTPQYVDSANPLTSASGALSAQSAMSNGPYSNAINMALHQQQQHQQQHAAQISQSQSAGNPPVSVFGQQAGQSSVQQQPAVMGQAGVSVNGQPQLMNGAHQQHQQQQQLQQQQQALHYHQHQMAALQHHHASLQSTTSASLATAAAPSTAPTTQTLSAMPTLLPMSGGSTGSGSTSNSSNRSADVASVTSVQQTAAAQQAPFAMSQYPFTSPSASFVSPFSQPGLNPYSAMAQTPTLAQTQQLSPMDTKSASLLMAANSALSQSLAAQSSTPAISTGGMFTGSVSGSVSSSSVGLAGGEGGTGSLIHKRGLPQLKLDIPEKKEHPVAPLNNSTTANPANSNSNSNSNGGGGSSGVQQHGIAAAAASAAQNASSLVGAGSAPTIAQAAAPAALVGSSSSPSPPVSAVVGSVPPSASAMWFHQSQLHGHPLQSALPFPSPFDPSQPHSGMHAAHPSAGWSTIPTPSPVMPSPSGFMSADGLPMLPYSVDMSAAQQQQQQQQQQQHAQQQQQQQHQQYQPAPYPFPSAYSPFMQHAAAGGYPAPSGMFPMGGAPPPYWPSAPPSFSSTHFAQPGLPPTHPNQAAASAVAAAAAQATTAGAADGSAATGPTHGPHSVFDRHQPHPLQQQPIAAK